MFGGNNFGQGIAINSGDLCLVGAPGYYDGGGVFIYRKYDSEWGWNKIQDIYSDNPNYGDFFGYSVSINDKGDVIAIGAPNASLGDGEVHIYTGNKSKWNNVCKISGNLSGNEHFGFDLKLNLSGNRLIVGTISSSNTGKAYLYSGSGNNWNLITGFYEVDGYNNSATAYGNKVSISNNAVVIGSKLNSNKGAVFIYTGNNNIWKKHQIISGLNSDSFFGDNLYINNTGSCILISAPNDISNSGVVYLYEKIGNYWQNTYSITGEWKDTGELPHLGRSLYINESGNFIFTSDDTNYGTIYNYKKDTNWYKNLVIKNQKTFNGDKFGGNFTVTKDSSKLLIGVPNFIYTQGQAYIYSEPWSNFKEYYGVNQIETESNCICNQLLNCGNCCGVTPSFTINTGYFNNLNQFAININILIKNNNCNSILDTYNLYSNGNKIYTDIYQTGPFQQYNKILDLKNISFLNNNLINLELKVYNLGNIYLYETGININNY